MAHNKEEPSAKSEKPGVQERKKADVPERSRELLVVEIRSKMMYHNQW